MLARRANAILWHQLAAQSRQAFAAHGKRLVADLQVEKVESFPPGHEEEVVQLACSLDRHSNHPLARAIVRYAKQRGIAGMVIWGAIRDSAEIGAADFPVYAAGITHRGPYKNGPGEINVPVIIGEMPVNPGDIVVGDADGLVAIRQEDAERVLASAKAILAKETAAMKQFLAGTADRSWVDKALVEKGYKLR